MPTVVITGSRSVSAPPGCACASSARGARAAENMRARETAAAHPSPTRAARRLPAASTIRPAMNSIRLTASSLSKFSVRWPPPLGIALPSQLVVGFWLPCDSRRAPLTRANCGAAAVFLGSAAGAVRQGRCHGKERAEPKEQSTIPTGASPGGERSASKRCLRITQLVGLRQNWIVGIVPAPARADPGWIDDRARGPRRGRGSSSYAARCRVGASRPGRRLERRGTLFSNTASGGMASCRPASRIPGVCALKAQPSVNIWTSCRCLSATTGP